MTYKILVTGSRDLTDQSLVYSELDRLLGMHGTVIVIHGAARGADSYADRWALERSGATPVRVIPDWANDGWSAGPTRNHRMLELNPNIVLAFFKEGAKNSGTSHMVKIAEEANVQVLRFTEEFVD